MTMVDPQASEHVWIQARELIRARVKDGTWTSRLPAEGDMATLLKCSRGSVRRAVRSLVEDGTLVVLRGRGVFVAKR